MRLPSDGKLIRVVGFDDAPFSHAFRAKVTLAGVVCAGTRFEGLLLGRILRDGWTATRELVRMLRGGKFLPQIHLVLLDGIAFGGLAMVDLETLANELGRPCVAVMRKQPDLAAFERVIRKLPQAERRLAMLRRAGPIHESRPFFFQVRGAEPEEIARVLPQLTDRGHVPEALCLAHVIGTALATGESGRRA
ncbi:MAG: endonuclease dU [Polyangiales bacterium]